ncbi:PPA1309 family protein [Nocardioides sp. R-C-SC26]|uniref:PPA1309 family protein n=1 Tax=Nocardioides sp. R-C-SC26 TaxID=2870414 RepID=UPI001E4AC006|nr:PPA1309 family protein [Nocardioides sp. R-C-SC26]
MTSGDTHEGSEVREPWRDGVLATAVREIEEHVASAGWDSPARLFALVDTARLIAEEPALARTMGLDAVADGLTAVEQDHLDTSQPLEQALQQIEWPLAVAGCAAVVERLVLPPGADTDLPEGAAAAQEYARNHPDRQEVRIVAAVTRVGDRCCALRMRSHDDATSVVLGEDLVPGLLELLTATLDPVPE